MRAFLTIGPILILLSSFCCQAQNKLAYSPSTNFKLKPYFIASTLPQPIGSSGGNKVWDFSKATQTGGWTQGYYNCATQTCKCPAGYDFETVLSPYDGCFRIKKDGLYLRTGAATKDTDIAFLPFSFAYGDRFAYTYRRRQRSTPAPITDGIGIDSTIGFAWGNITTPLNGPTAALLVKRTVSTSDTGLIDPMQSGVPYQAVLHTRHVQYVWYSLNDGSYLFVVDSMFAMQVPGNGSWSEIDDQAGFQATTETVGVHDGQGLTTGLLCYPNPAVDKLTVLLPSYNRSASLVLRNALGQTIANIPDTELSIDGNKTVIDMSGLPKGFYTLQFSSEGNRVVQKVTLR